MYYKTVKMTIEEALEKEMNRGFESADEFVEVMRELALEYNLFSHQILSKYYQIKSGKLNEVYSI